MDFLENNLYDAHVGKSAYALQLARWFAVFGRENFKVHYCMGPTHTQVRRVRLRRSVLCCGRYHGGARDSSRFLPYIAVASPGESGVLGSGSPPARSNAGSSIMRRAVCRWLEWSIETLDL